MNKTIKNASPANITAKSSKPQNPSPDIMKRFENSNFLLYVIDVCEKLFMYRDEKSLSGLRVLYSCQYQLLQEALFVMFGKWYIFTSGIDYYGLAESSNPMDMLFLVGVGQDGKRSLLRIFGEVPCYQYDKTQAVL